MSKTKQVTQSIILLLFLAFNSALFAQDNSEAIKSDFANYLKAIKTQDFETSLDYLVEDVFEIIPKETMLTLMEQMFNVEGVEFTFGDFVINEIKEPIVVDSTSYVILNYENEMSIKYTQQQEETSEEDKKLTQLMTQSLLEQQFGKGNVTYNESTEFFDIKAIKKAIAIYDEDEKTWKFLVVEKGNPFLLKSILPSSILEKVLTED
ncbi:MAG: hypothetical protein CMO82_08120 [Winogradskyella sp.]|uniref:DUF4348 domain-containing protein n=1 Tax=Winogradskyella poriferorum TaxID=307627 RepID=A0ABU7WBI3_9FLAO|nr:hypothetical protein [Flavobacteriaceae bacterium]MBL86608.1 hypothetical protein [Winogradskyella sp.]|tara:strand:- start:492 stop:1112 length:621 start_codon:yes stop_codon:yes gene_type:complete